MQPRVRLSRCLVSLISAASSQSEYLRVLMPMLDGGTCPG
jgi:hypothetical protein